MERGAVGREKPVSDGVVFGGCRAVSVWPKVEANPFNTVEEEVAFLGVEGKAPFGENVANAFEVEE